MTSDACQEGVLALHSGMTIWLEGHDLEAIVASLKACPLLQSSWERFDSGGALASRLIREARWSPPDVWLLSVEPSTGMRRVVSVCSQVDVPIVVASKRANSVEQRAIEAGADAFCSWPDDGSLLGPRVWALLRRASGMVRAIGRTDVKLLHSDHRLIVAQIVVQLTPVEYRLVAALSQHLNDWVPMEALWSRMSSTSPTYDSSRLRTLLLRVRRKLGQHSWVLRSERGKGTMLTNVPPERIRSPERIS